jgi:hypothetical protein
VNWQVSWSIHSYAIFLTVDNQARGGLRSRTSSIRIGGSQAGGPSSPQSTLSSVLHSAPQPLLSLPEVASELTAEDKASEDNTPTPRPPSSPVFPLPASRQQAISHFPLVHPSIALKDNENAFSRDFMTTVLGGSIQPLIVRYGAVFPSSMSTNVLIDFIKSGLASKERYRRNEI